MADTVVIGSLIYSHVIPLTLAFIGVILLCSGIMDRKKILPLQGLYSSLLQVPYHS
ncbi:hypothetical protein [Methanobacterium petrolearium]|uniref:hypothetical protein n=1 Tax=Methanobacterium petrolearium TaxID=710190 RepID=UPI0030812D61